MNVDLRRCGEESVAGAQPRCAASFRRWLPGHERKGQTIFNVSSPGTNEARSGRRWLDLSAGMTRSAIAPGFGLPVGVSDTHGKTRHAPLDGDQAGVDGDGWGGA